MLYRGGHRTTAWSHATTIPYRTVPHEVRVRYPHRFQVLHKLSEGLSEGRGALLFEEHVQSGSSAGTDRRNMNAPICEMSPGEITQHVKAARVRSYCLPEVV